MMDTSCGRCFAKFKCLEQCVCEWRKEKARRSFVGVATNLKPTGNTISLPMNLEKAFGLATKRHKKRKRIERKPLCPAMKPFTQ